MKACLHGAEIGFFVLSTYALPYTFGFRYM